MTKMESGTPPGGQFKQMPSDLRSPSGGSPTSGAPSSQYLSPTRETLLVLVDAQVAVLRLLGCLAREDPAAVSSILAIESLLSGVVHDKVKRAKKA